MPSFTLIDQDNLKNYHIKDHPLSFKEVYLNAQRNFDTDSDLTVDKLYNKELPKIMGLNTIQASLRYSVPFENLVSNYKRLRSNVTNFNNTQNPLPIAVRYVTENDTYFVERFPFQKTVDLSNTLRKQFLSKEDEIKIWIPWTLTSVSAIHPSNIRILYSNQSLSQETDRYVGGLFPNSYYRGDICFGQSTHMYPELFGSYDASSTVNDVKTIYTTLFNEYFDAGWNADLTANIYHNLKSYTILKNTYPMLHRFVFPDKDIVEEKLGHVNKRKTKILQSLAARSHTPLQQHMYTLMMLSTFSLEETLQFYKEYIDLLVNKKSDHVINFSNLIKDSSYDTDAACGLLGISTLLSPPNQVNENLVSNVDLQDTDISNAYIFYYDSYRRNGSHYEMEFSFTYSREMYVGTNFINYQNIFKDYINTSTSSVSKNLTIYFVDIKDFSWEKTVFKPEDFPERKNSGINSLFPTNDLLAAHFASKYYSEKYIKQTLSTKTELV